MLAGEARDFASAQDHAMIRVLTEGVRRSELLGMTITALPGDLVRNPGVRVVPLKGARAAGEGRLIWFTPSTARALTVYLLGGRDRSHLAPSSLSRAVSPHPVYKSVTRQAIDLALWGTGREAGPPSVLSPEVLRSG